MDLKKLYSNMEEIVTKEEAEKLAEKKNITAYIGFEPSGMPHIGTALMWPKKLSELQDQIRIYILLADWHAMINNKLNGNLDSIRKSGELLKKSLIAEGLDRAEYIWASDVVSDKSYWETFIRTAKSTTLPRINRALPIMGRTEGDAAKDFGMYIYPVMQVTDIFHLNVDIAFGGMDQRHAHMLARDISDRLKMKKVVSVHGPLLSSLKGNQRMDSFVKMSKSDPSSAVFISDDEKAIEKKIRSAYCPIGVTEGNPVTDILKYVIIPYYHDVITINRSSGNFTVENFESFRAAYEKGEIHPADLKATVSAIINEMIDPARKVVETSDLDF